MRQTIYIGKEGRVMVEFLLIVDKETGKSLQILRQFSDYIVIEDAIELSEVKARSIGKVIRNWMKANK